MGIGVREFERRVKNIYNRWYVKSRSLVVISGAGVHEINEPTQVWERPIAKGTGFETDSLVMEIDGPISLKHLKKLKQGHWQRTQNMQKSVFDFCREKQETAKKIESQKTAYERKQFVLEHRHAFRETSRRLGLSRGSIRDGLGV
jgi:hypothetical protein